MSGVLRNALSTLPCCEQGEKAELDDSNVDAVIARNLWKNHRILPPTSKNKQHWDLMMMLLVFYNCVYIPIELCFLGNLGIGKTTAHEVVDYLIDSLFFFDILINCRTAYYDEDYEMVLDGKQIFRNYRKSWWFYIDLLAVVPFDLLLALFLIGSDSSGSSIGTVFGMFKLPRLLRLLRIFKKLDVVAAANALRIVALMVMFCLIAHWFACIWWIIGWQEYQADLREARSGGNGEGLSHGVSWLQRIPGELLTNGTSFEHQYLSSMYWSLTTLMKTPWVGPDTVGEKMFASLAVVMGAILFAALLGNVTALVQTFDKGNAQKREKITTLHQFNASRKVPLVLQRKLMAYVDAEWSITSGLDDSSVLAQLPGQLRGNIVASIYKDTLLKAPLFSSCSLECAKSLLLRLQPEVCLQKEVLIARDQLCQEVYLLMRGAMQVASSEGEVQTGVRKPALMFRMIEKPGSIIGHIDPFQREVPRYPFLVTAVRQSHLVSLTRVDVLDVLSNFEGEDCASVLKVLRVEHQNTITSLTDKRERPTAAARSAEGEPAESAVKESKPGAPDSAPSEQTLQTLRTRVTEMEQKLAKCVDDMQAARECTEVLPHLVFLVNSVTQDNLNS
uniref:Ion transport domain-containing protein n=1 Tax=Haptolina brevifila TaxID=156173 RepID=A0A7S2J4H1_9EUKA